MLLMLNQVALAHQAPVFWLGDRRPHVRSVLPSKHHRRRRSIKHRKQSKKRHHNVASTLKHRPAIKHHKRSKHPIASIKKSPIVASKAVIRIAIDPGHGGFDPGAVSRDKRVREKDVVLSIAKQLRRLLNHNPSFKGYLIRKRDRYISLRQRLYRAHRLRAHLFVAIHTDSNVNRAAHGASVYVLSQRSRLREAHRLTYLSRHRRHFRLGGQIDLAEQDPLIGRTMLDLSQNFSMGAGRQIGRLMLRTLKPVTGLHRQTLGVAGFIVLKAPDIPSLLVETGFVSHPSEARRLKNPVYQKRVALALYRAIILYFKYHPNVAGLRPRPLG